MMRRKVEMKKYNKLYEKVCLLLLSVLYLLLFSGSTSPLFPYDYGWDSALFILVGKGINSGKNLYADLFDHKGPIIFFIEAIGDRLHDTYGIFFVQILFMYITLWLMLCIIRLLGTKENKWRVLFVFLIFLSYPLANGNLTEEYSLPFIIFPLYCAIKKVVNNQFADTVDFFVYGFCFGILAFIRLNNSIMIVGIVLFWVLFLLLKKQYKQLAINLLWGLIGILIVCLPIIIYFWQKNTLYDMLNATFIYNFKYGNAGFKNQIYQFSDPKYCLRQGILFFPLFVSFGIFWKNYKCKILNYLLLFLTGLNILILLYGKGYNHYFTIAVPLSGVAACVFLQERKDDTETERIIRGAALIALCGYLFLNIRIIVVNTNNNYLSEKFRAQKEEISDNFNKIPLNERDNIIGFNIHSRCYLMGNVLPSYKYYTAQEAWAQNDSNILVEFYQYIEKERPLWIVTEADSVADRMRSILTQDYELRMADEYCKYYRLRRNK